MALDRSLSTPLYHQVRDLLLEEIQSGDISPGERIPSEAELEARYEISRITVRQAIQTLVQEGLLYRQQGRGTFVARPRVRHSLNALTSFSRQMLDRGMSPSTKLLEAEIVAARGQVQESLAVPDGELVTKLRRLRLADKEVMGLQTAYIPISLCPDLVDVIGDNVSLYDLFRDKYGLRPARATENYAAVLLESYEARLLDHKQRQPALAAERITYLSDNRALEYVVSILRADRYTLTVELHGEGDAER
jgi:GntR family transcriptional regulator